MAREWCVRVRGARAGQEVGAVVAVDRKGWRVVIAPPTAGWLRSTARGALRYLRARTRERAGADAAAARAGRADGKVEGCARMDAPRRTGGTGAWAGSRGWDADAQGGGRSTSAVTCRREAHGVRAGAARSARGDDGARLPKSSPDIGRARIVANSRR